MIKCEDLTRPDVKQKTNSVGNFKSTNVKPLSLDELNVHKNLIINERK